MARGRADGGRHRRVARRHQHGLPGQARGRRRVRLGADAGAASWRRSSCARCARAVPAHMPVTVKHRAGWDEHHRNAPEFACAMVEAGAEMITVHGRTRTQGFSGKSDRGIIGKVRDARAGAHPGRRQRRRRRRRRLLPHARGDRLRRRDDRPRRARQPVAVPRLRERLARRADPGPTLARARAQCFRRHVDLIAAHTPPKKLVHEVRKAVAWYAKGLRDSAHVRERAFQRPGSGASARDRVELLRVAGCKKKIAPREIVSDR